MKIFFVYELAKQELSSPNQSSLCSRGSGQTFARFGASPKRVTRNSNSTI